LTCVERNLCTVKIFSLRDSFFICTQNIVAIKIFLPDFKKSDSRGGKKCGFPVLKLRWQKIPFEVDIFKYILHQQDIISLFYYLFHYTEFLPNIFSHVVFSLVLCWLYSQFLNMLSIIKPCVMQFWKGNPMPFHCAKLRVRYTAQLIGIKMKDILLYFLIHNYCVLKSW